MLHLEGYASDIMRIVDKLDKVGQDKLGLMLAEEPYINEDAAGEILEFILIRGSNAEVLARQEQYRGQYALFDVGLDELPMTEDLAPAVRLATELRAAGVRTQLYTEQKKFKAKMAYADKLAIPYALFLGEDELAGNVVACKDMTTGVQTTLSVPETISLIRAGLREKNRGAIILEQSNKGE